MTSHNKDRKSYQVTNDQYKAFYERFQETFNIEDIDLRTINKRWYNNPRVKDILEQSRALYKEIEASKTESELNKINKHIKNLPIHQRDLTAKIQEQKINLSYSRFSEFAKAKNIKYDENTIAKKEKWKNKGYVISIRRNGKILTWAKI